MFPFFRFGTLKRCQLRFGQHEFFLGVLGLERIMAPAYGLEIMMQPDSAHALCRDDQRIAIECFVGDREPAVGRQFQLQFEHDGFDLRIPHGSLPRHETSKRRFWLQSWRLSQCKYGELMVFFTWRGNLSGLTAALLPA